MNTRSGDVLLRLARIYVEMDFTFIPIDEEGRFNDSDRIRLLRIINALWKEKEALAILSGTPFNKFAREPIVGRLVGRDYKNLINEYQDMYSQQQFGRKRKVVTSAQKKSRADAKKAMKMMWKEGITLKQAWKKVKSGKKY